MNFDQFIKQHKSTFKAKSSSKMHAIPVEGNATHGSIEVKKGDVVKVTNHRNESLDFIFNDDEYNTT